MEVSNYQNKDKKELKAQVENLLQILEDNLKNNVKNNYKKR